MNKMKAIIPLVASLCLAAAVRADEILVKANPHESTLLRWTAEDFASARPMPLPMVEEITDATREAPASVLETEHFASEAAEPTLPDHERFAFHQTLFEYQTPADDPEAEVPETSDPPPKNRGSAGFHYTSSRLIPGDAVTRFPYSAVGKLFFSKTGEDHWVCSGAVIGRRLVVTAGHCVHGGPGEGWYEDFVFVPAYYYGDAPFGTWEYSWVVVNTRWSHSGEVPNAADFALLEMRDRNHRRISEVTGKLGFITDNAAPNHLHILGYPSAFDSGREMHQVTTGDYRYYRNSTVIYGSDMGGGSSGGPWVQNFNRKARGQGGGRNKARAAVVGVTSFGWHQSAPGYRAQGASELNQCFKIIRQAACSHQAGNC